MTISKAKLATPMGEELSTVTSKEEVYWKSTCKECAYRGNRSIDEDWMFLNAERYTSIEESKCKEMGRYPERCTDCDTLSRRYSRMQASLDKILDIRDDIMRNQGSIFSKPKMITIGNDQNLDEKEFKKRFKRFRDESNWMLGGTYVLEQGKENGMWHMHGVFLAPYIGRCDDPQEHGLVPEKDKDGNKTGEMIPCSCKLQRWSKTAADKYGLGNVHYQEAKISKNRWERQHLGNYLAKYMCKDGNRKQSFGALYKCEKDSIDDKRKRWFQPNRKEFRKQMRLWIKEERSEWI